ncbi:triphosphoribosyl-dephospho-CoA synthase CitG [Lactobacillus sp. PSON]|uniref:triphosphoribosyl-dephospho-CoA synthase CitG n=1 Tax=Lactobacillus sp. PSON TaxID=3455454 RepID=UPI0040433DA9
MKKIVNNALKALLYEVVTLPKPGLVDPADTGSHLDMDVFTFINSSLALQPYLEKAAEIGENFFEEDLTKMFISLRQVGIIAEKEMLQATNNVNTHKGAIFSLGIFVCARSYAKPRNLNTFIVIKKMCHNLVRHDFAKLNQHNATAGELQYLKYKLGGVRQLAEEGYPVVENISLPYLKNRPGTLNERLIDTLMVLATKIDDSTFIKRSGDAKKITWLHQASQQFLDKGGCQSREGLEYLHQLNVIFKQENYSIGGCADLLIVTIFMALEYNFI